MKEQKEYSDFSGPMRFYQLWRGISDALFHFFKNVLIIFGVDWGDEETGD